MGPTHPTPPRRRWDPRSRDAALSRTRRITGLIAVIAAGASGLCSVVAAHAFKGHSRTAPRHAARPAPVTVPGPQRVPAIASAPRPPSEAPSSSSSPAPTAAPAPVPAPTPAPLPPPEPAPVVSGGS